MTTQDNDITKQDVNIPPQTEQEARHNLRNASCAYAIGLTSFLC